MRQSAVSFEANGLKIEGVVAQPDAMAGPIPGVVICHPSPLNGGNMDNNVVLAVSAALVEAGFATLRFNFRGVGNSQGEHAKGELEHQEALGAMDFLGNWQSVDANNLGLAGYSFGTGIILGNPGLQERAKAYALVSPSIGRLEESALRSNQRPKFVISGDRDRLIESPGLEPVLESFAKPFTCEFYPGADHFWVGQEEMMALKVGRFFTENLT
jgi:alpha/beta superfamily hydrolase